MKPSFAFSLLGIVFSLAATAQVTRPNPIAPPPPPAGESVSFNADLSTQKCSYMGDLPVMCLISIDALSSVAVPLSRVLDNSGSNIEHFKGFHTQVNEKNGVRSIGIVTVEVWVYHRGTPSEMKSYHFRVEILDQKGPAAEMELYTSNPDQMSTVTLKGRERKVGNDVYTPIFRIGPKFDVCISNGSSPVEPGTPIPCPENPTPNAATVPWSVIRGSLM